MKSPQKAIRCIRANNQPILLPLALSRSELHKLSITDDEISRRAKAIAQAHEFRARLGDAIAGRYPPSDPSLYVEEQIYDGFPTRTDQFLMEQFHSATWEERVKLIEQLEDKRFRDLGYRLIFVERPSVLTAEKREGMDLWCNERLNAFGEVPWLTIAGALAELDNSRGEFTEETYLEIRNWLKGLSPRPPPGPLLDPLFDTIFMATRVHVTLHESDL
jgi:exodeoxyribonuclease I